MFLGPLGSAGNVEEKLVVNFKLHTVEYVFKFGFKPRSTTW